MNALLKRTCPLLVFAVGLISCNKQNDSSLRIPEPAWETAQGVQKFSTVNQPALDNGFHSRSLSDRLSFEGPAASLHAKAICRGESLSNPKQLAFYDYDVMLAIPGKIAVFSLLPARALHPAVLNKPLYCQFKFSATNEDGTHNFGTGDVLIKDSQKSEGVEVEAPITKLEERFFTKAAFEMRSAQALDAKLICDQLEVTTHHPDHQKLKLSEFTLPKEDRFRRFPLQTCRIAGLEKGAVTMLSLPLQVQFDAAGPKVETHSLPTPTREFSAPIQAFEFKIENPTNKPLRFQIPRLEPKHFVAAAYMSGASDNYCQMEGLSQASLEWASWRFNNPESQGAMISEKTMTDLILPSHAVVTGQIIVKLNWMGQPSTTLANLSLPKGYILRFAKPLEMRVFTDGETFETYTIPWTIEDVERVGSVPPMIPTLPCAG